MAFHPVIAKYSCLSLAISWISWTFPSQTPTLTPSKNCYPALNSKPCPFRPSVLLCHFLLEPRCHQPTLSCLNKRHWTFLFVFANGLPFLSVTGRRWCRCYWHVHTLLSLPGGNSGGPTYRFCGQICVRFAFQEAMNSRWTCYAKSPRS